MAAAGAAEPKAPPGLAKEALWHLANLAVLWTFAVAQPLFDLLGDNPEFFAARGSSGFDIISFSVLLVILPPLVGLGIELLFRLLGRPFFKAAHVVLIGLLVTLIAAQALKKAFDASDGLLIGLSVAIGAGLALLYARAEPVRSFLNVLTPAPLVFLLLFLLGSPVSKLAFPDEAGARTVGGITNANVVVVLLDELPSNTLVDENGELDKVRYPGFAELAKNATWFKNAFTIYDSTERAQPAIMDGNLPAKDRLPISADHPNSIFSLFAKTHRLNVSEEATSVCSRDLCKDTRPDEPYGDRISSMTEDLGLVWLHVVSPPGIEADLNSVSENWGDFGGEGGAGSGNSSSDQNRTHARSNLAGGRRARFEEWMDQIKPGQRPSLNFKHTLLPHVPWQFIPDGRRYRRQPNDAVPGMSNQSFNSQEQLDVLLQRHFLQTGFADLMLQELWRHLKREGMWDNSLIVVAADHGVAFIKGRRDRRRLDAENYGEIAPIPLFIKAPGQKKGAENDAYVETIDILPTILDLLNVNAKVKMDGHSAFSDVVKRRRDLRILQRNTFKPLEFTVAQFEARKALVRERNNRLFGTGSEGPERIYRIGPHQELIGKPAPPGEGKGSVDIREAGDYANVDTKSDFIPTHPVGKLDGGTPGRDIAVAVNGRIAATGKTFTLAEGEEGEFFSVMIPPDSLRDGRNRIEVYEISPSGSLTRLGGI
jgi:hypothetical protein